MPAATAATPETKLWHCPYAASRQCGLHRYQVSATALASSRLVRLEQFANCSEVLAQHALELRGTSETVERSYL
jgi:hypothetical protein